jgi:membrane-associated phospholipid phosphatase
MRKGVVARVTLYVVGFVALAVLNFHRHGASFIDTPLLHSYRAVANSRVFRVANIVTDLGAPGVVVVLGVAAALVSWFRYRSLPWALACVAAPGVAGVGETLLKVLIARQRPATAVLTGEDGNGFPSGHAAGFTALAFVIALAVTAGRGRRSRFWAVAIALAASASMAVTRVLVGAHYPTDVIAGVLLGIGVAELTALLAPFALPILEKLSRGKTFTSKLSGGDRSR